MEIRIHSNISLEIKEFIYLDKHSIGIFLNDEVNVLVLNLEGQTFKYKREAFFPVWFLNKLSVETINEVDNK